MAKRSTGTSRQGTEALGLAELLKLLRSNGVVRYKTAELELDLSMIPPDALEAGGDDEDEPETPVAVRRSRAASRARKLDRARKKAKARNAGPKTIYDNPLLYPDGEAPEFDDAEGEA